MGPDGVGMPVLTKFSPAIGREGKKSSEISANALPSAGRFARILAEHLQMDSIHSPLRE
jgi:hypothetical protein